MDLHCEFKREWRYKCIVKSVLPNDSKTIRIIGDHAKGRTNRDVEVFVIGKVNLGEFPQGIGGVFPSLVQLVIENCGITRISRDDFAGLGNVKFLYLTQNRISELENDVFTNVRGLQHLDLSQNLLRVVHPMAIELLTRLQHLDLRRNPTIDKKWDNLLNNTKDRNKMLEEINSKCSALSL